MFRTPMRLEKWIAFDGDAPVEVFAAVDPEADSGTEVESQEDGDGGDAGFSAESGEAEGIDVFSASALAANDIVSSTPIVEDGANVGAITITYSPEIAYDPNDVNSPFFDFLSTVNFSTGYSNGANTSYVQAGDIYFEITAPLDGKFVIWGWNTNDFLASDHASGWYAFGGANDSTSTVFVFKYYDSDTKTLIEDDGKYGSGEIAYTEDGGIYFHISNYGHGLSGSGTKYLYGNGSVADFMRSIIFVADEGKTVDSISGFSINAYYLKDSMTGGWKYFHGQSESIYESDDPGIIKIVTNENAGGESGGGSGEGGGESGGESGGEEGGESGGESGGEEGGESGGESGGEEGGESGGESGGEEGGENGGESGGGESGGEEGGGSGGEEVDTDPEPLTPDPVNPPPPTPGDNGQSDGGPSGEPPGGEPPGGEPGGEGDGGEGGPGGDDMMYIYRREDAADSADAAQEKEEGPEQTGAVEVELESLEDRAIESAAVATVAELARDVEALLTAVREEREVLLQSLTTLQVEYLRRGSDGWSAELRDVLRYLFTMGNRETGAVNQIIGEMHRQIQVFRDFAPERRDGMLAESLRELVDSAERRTGEANALSKALEAVMKLLRERDGEGQEPDSREVLALFERTHSEALGKWEEKMERMDPMGKELAAAEREPGE